MSLEIRQATLEDAEAVLTYYIELPAEKLPFIMDNPVPTLEQEKKFVQKHDGERDVLFLALSQGRVVGLSGYNIAAHRKREAVKVGGQFKARCVSFLRRMA